MTKVINLDGTEHEPEAAISFPSRDNLNLAAHFTALARMAADGRISQAAGVILTSTGVQLYRSGLKLGSTETFALIGAIDQMKTDLMLIIGDFEDTVERTDLDEGA